MPSKREQMSESVIKMTPPPKVAASASPAADQLCVLAQQQQPPLAGPSSSSSSYFSPLSLALSGLASNHTSPTLSSTSASSSTENRTRANLNCPSQAAFEARKNEIKEASGGGRRPKRQQHIILASFKRPTKLSDYSLPTHSKLIPPPTAKLEAEWRRRERPSNRIAQRDACRPPPCWQQILGATLFMLSLLLLLLCRCCCCFIASTTSSQQSAVHDHKQTPAGLSLAPTSSSNHGQLVRRLEELGLDYQVIYLRREQQQLASLMLLYDDDNNDSSNNNNNNNEEHDGAASRESPRARHSLLLAPSAGIYTGPATAATAGQQRQNKTNLLIKALGYELRLELELNHHLFGPELIQKHFLPKGAHFSTQKLERCYYHARSAPASRPSRRPQAIGALRTCNGISGIIHVNNESLVIHPFYSGIVSSGGQVDPLAAAAAGQQSSSGSQSPEANSGEPKHAKHPHIIYRYKSTLALGAAEGSVGECGNSHLHEWALKQYSSETKQQFRKKKKKRKRASLERLEDETNDQAKTANRRDGHNCSWTRSGKCQEEIGYEEEYSKNNNKRKNYKRTTNTISAAAAERNPVSLLSKRDVGLKEKYIELALILSQDMFTKRNLSTRLEVLQDAIQIINCLDLYFRSANTRVAIVYIETWAHGDQITLSSDIKQSLYNFLDYSTRKLYKVSMDAIHLLTGGLAQRFADNKSGMSIPDSICTPRAVSISQETSVYEPFVAASTMAHMLGHNLGMEHDEEEAEEASNTSDQQHQQAASSTSTTQASSDSGSDKINNHQVATPPQRPPLLGFKQAKHDQSSSSSDSELQDDHEEETKSARSLAVSANEAEAEAEEDNSGGRSMKITTSTNNTTAGNHFCKTNCLMSEKFLYLQAPVALGADTARLENSSASGLEDYVDLSGPSNKDGEELREQQDGHQHLNDADADHEESPEAWAKIEKVALPFRFSQRSLETYHKLLRLGHGICLFNRPNQVEDFNTCGNGIKEEGEDCDCGKLGECFEHDSCCDPITCKFRAGVQCISGACCDRCRYRPRGFVCRRARDECDLAEICDGRSFACSPDVFKQNGQACAGGRGYCYLGQCPSHDSQCLDLWGSDGRQADKYCYQALNSNGTVSGNCGPRESQQQQQHKFDIGGGSSTQQLLMAPNRYGNSIVGTARSLQTQGQRDLNAVPGSLSSSVFSNSPASSNKFRRCEPDNVLCGTLQCQLGNMRPVIAEDDLDGDRDGDDNDAYDEQHHHEQQTDKAQDGPVGSNDNTNNANYKASGSGASQHEYSRLVLKQQGKEHECKAVTRSIPRSGQKGTSAGAQTRLLASRQQQTPPSSISYVRQGTKCGPNKVCFNQACQPIDLVYAEAYKLCPRDEQGAFCSGHGVCSTANRCHCDSGWKSSDCSQRAEEVELSSNTTEQAEQLREPHHHLQQQSAAVKKNLMSPLDASGSGGGGGVGQVYITNEPRAGSTAPTAWNTTSTTATTEEQATTTATMQPQPPPQPNAVTPAPSTSSNIQVQDKKKHDALSAPTLVLILVSIVAAVYLGFALMANCYRRKGFIKPDKVLRHHQMNCKLDALRSSFIAKRLADAELAAHSVDLLQPAEQQQQQQQQHPNHQHAAWPTSAGPRHFSDSNEALMSPVRFNGLPSEALGGAQIGDSQYVAEPHHAVHYGFEQQQQQQQQLERDVQQKQQQQERQPMFGHELAGSGDHIPLLLSASEMHRKRALQKHQQQQQQQLHNQSAFNSVRHIKRQQQQQQPLIMFASGKPQLRTLHQQLQQPMMQLGGAANNNNHNELNRPLTSFKGSGQTLMGRAFSLGNVNQSSSPRHCDELNDDSFDDDDDDQLNDLEDLQYNNNSNELAPANSKQVPSHHHHQQQQHSFLARQSAGRQALPARRSRGPGTGSHLAGGLIGGRQRQAAAQQTGRRSNPSTGANRSSFGIVGGANLPPPAPFELDSCSAPSSPERRPRAPYWLAASHQHRQPAPAPRLAGPLYRVLSRDGLPPLPPPPLPPLGLEEQDRQLQPPMTRYEKAEAAELRGPDYELNGGGNQSGSEARLIQAGPAALEAGDDRDGDGDEVEDGPENGTMIGNDLRVKEAQQGYLDDDEDDGDEEDEDDDNRDDIDDEDELDDYENEEDQAAEEEEEEGELGGISIRSCSSSNPRQRAIRSAAAGRALAGKLAGLRPGQHHHNYQPQQQLQQSQRPRQHTPKRGQRRAAGPEAVAATNQWSLIAQLQQLEHFQSLHQRQTSSLHEFFSLPLSVQLSALLARGLADQQQQQQIGAISAAPISLSSSSSQQQQNQQLDELLNSLNNSSVAKSSRRSFRSGRPASSSLAGQVAGAAGPPAAPPSSRSNEINDEATPRSTLMRKQQQQHQHQNHELQAQNLQALIERLQKLHNQTVLQSQQAAQGVRPTSSFNRRQRRLESEEEDDEETLADAGQQQQQQPPPPGRRSLAGSRQSTLGRQGRRSLASARELSGSERDLDATGVSLGASGSRRRPAQQPQQVVPRSTLDRRAKRTAASDIGNACQPANNKHQQQQHSSSKQAAPSRPTSRSEFVYSMSDSEDGSCNYVSRMLACSSSSSARPGQLQAHQIDQHQQDHHHQQSVHNNGNQQQQQQQQKPQQQAQQASPVTKDSLAASRPTAGLSVETMDEDGDDAVGREARGKKVQPKSPSVVATAAAAIAQTNSSPASSKSSSLS